MKRYVALLRGINVGGRNSVKMKDLQCFFLSLGFLEVKTYIQSGNVVFSAPNDVSLKIDQKIKEKIYLETGFDIPILVFEKSEWKNIISKNTFLNVNKYQHINIEKLYTTLLSETPKKDEIDKINSLDKKQNEELVFVDNCVYLHCPNGYGKTKFNNTFLEKKLGVTATTRNWKTILKINELLQSTNN